MQTLNTWPLVRGQLDKMSSNNTEEAMEKIEIIKKVAINLYEEIITTFGEEDSEIALPLKNFYNIDFPGFLSKEKEIGKPKSLIHLKKLIERSTDLIQNIFYDLNSKN